MLMKPEKKGMAAMILAKANPESPDSMKKLNEEMMSEGASHGDMAGEPQEASDEIGLEAAADEMMQAFNSGDSKALMEALKSFMQMYK